MDAATLPTSPARLRALLRVVLRLIPEERAKWQAKLSTLHGSQQAVPEYRRADDYATEKNSTVLQQAIRETVAQWKLERRTLEVAVERVGASFKAEHQQKKRATLDQPPEAKKTGTAESSAEAMEAAAPPTKKRRTTISSGSMEASGRSSDCDHTPVHGRPLRVGTDCSGMEAPIQALLNLGVRFEHVCASDTDKHVRATWSSRLLFGREVSWTRTASGPLEGWRITTSSIGRGHATSSTAGGPEPTFP